MDQGTHLDTKKAVQCFLGHFESLSRLPFIADSEMEQLFGQEVRYGLIELDHLDSQKQFCRNCRNRCCRLVDCEIYSEDLSSCPVYHFRPVLCRMHYCNAFALELPLLIRELGDIYLDSLLAAQLIDGRKALLLDSPPLHPHSPDLIRQINTKLTESKFDLSTASSLIQSAVKKYRSFPGR
jgi:hypothetical protein